MSKVSTKLDSPESGKKCRFLLPESVLDWVDGNRFEDVGVTAARLHESGSWGVRIDGRISETY